MKTREYAKKVKYFKSCFLTKNEASKILNVLHLALYSEKPRLKENKNESNT